VACSIMVLSIGDSGVVAARAGIDCDCWVNARPQHRHGILVALAIIE
jgi:hypothetical protein